MLHLRQKALVATLPRLSKECSTVLLFSTYVDRFVLCLILVNMPITTLQILGILIIGMLVAYNDDALLHRTFCRATW